MPPKKAAQRVAVEEVAYQNPFVRDSDFEVFLRPGCEKIISITPSYGLGPRFRLGYQRLMHEDIELMTGDQTVPFEKDYGMYWVEADAEGFAVIRSQGGEDHFVLAMDKSVRDKRVSDERKRHEITNENMTDKEAAAQANRGLKRGSEYEVDELEREESLNY